MRYGYILCKFLILGPQMGPQITIFEKCITSSFTGTKNQIHISHGCDSSLNQISISENVLFSMLSNNLESSKFHMPSSFLKIFARAFRTWIFWVLLIVSTWFLIHMILSFYFLRFLSDDQFGAPFGAQSHFEFWNFDKTPLKTASFAISSSSALNYNWGPKWSPKLQFLKNI